MGLLSQRPQANVNAPNLPQMPPNLPGMGGLPTFTPQQTQGPRMGGNSTFMPQQAGGGGYSPFQLPQIDLSSIPRYGHGYEGEMDLNNMGRMQSLQSMFRTSYMPVPMGPWSLAGQRMTYADMPFESLGPRMNGQMPVTWYAEDWKRSLPD